MVLDKAGYIRAARVSSIGGHRVAATAEDPAHSPVTNRVTVRACRYQARTRAHRRTVHDPGRD